MQPAIQTQSATWSNASTLNLKNSPIRPYQLFITKYDVEYPVKMQLL